MNLWKMIKFVFSLPFVLILSWVVTHIMALFGIFTVAAYPIWVAFFPKSSICIGCQGTKAGEKCRLCNHTVEAGKLYPKTIRSVLLNDLLLLCLTILSLTIVYFENIVIDKSGILKNEKTVSFVIPSKNEYKTNEIFPMKIEIIGIEQSVNVVQADLTFDPDILEVLEISTTDSFATVFVQKEINNNLGYVRISGGVPNPGYDKSSGIFATAYFRTKVAGLATISFLPSSMVLANDGKGTNVLKDFPTSTYVVRPDKVSDSDAITQLELLKKDVLGVSTNVKTNVCKINLIPNNNDVLGAKIEEIQKETNSDGWFDKYFPVHEGVEKNIGTSLLVILDWFDEKVLEFYANILSLVFTR